MDDVVSERVSQTNARSIVEIAHLDNIGCNCLHFCSRRQDQQLQVRLCMTSTLRNESTPLNMRAVRRWFSERPGPKTSAKDMYLGNLSFLRFACSASCVYGHAGRLKDSCFSAVAVLAGAAAAYHTWYALPAAACQQVAHEGHHDGETEFANWSATHKVRPQQLFEPETIEDLQRVVAQCHATGDTYKQALQKL